MQDNSCYLQLSQLTNSTRSAIPALVQRRQTLNQRKHVGLRQLEYHQYSFETKAIVGLILLIQIQLFMIGLSIELIQTTAGIQNYLS